MKRKTKKKAIDQYGLGHSTVTYVYNPADYQSFRIPNLWLVQKGRKSAHFWNEAAKAFAGRTGKIRTFMEVRPPSSVMAILKFAGLFLGGMALMYAAYLAAQWIAKLT